MRGRLLLVAVLSLTTTACYYLQAARGQLSLLMSREPIAELLEDPDLDPDLREGLLRAEAARAFAVGDLGLPDNGSYRHLVRTEGERVLWNVFAAPELSLQPKRWCFPVAGCVSYRGYFSRRGAERYAARLSDDGWDVTVSPVAAYSTLGTFRDPVLDDMLSWPPPDLAGLLFHELAHQQLYLAGDTAFNEGFASAVEAIGVERWLELHPLSEEGMAAHRARQSRSAGFNALLVETRDELEVIYASDADDATKRAGKAQAFTELRARYAALRDGDWGGYAGYDAWFERELNNARLLPVITYRSWEGAFRALHREHGEDMQAFYAAAEALSELEREARVARLEALDAAWAADGGS